MASPEKIVWRQWDHKDHDQEIIIEANIAGPIKDGRRANTASNFNQQKGVCIAVVMEVVSNLAPSTATGGQPRESQCRVPSEDAQDQELFHRSGMPWTTATAGSWTSPQGRALSRRIRTSVESTGARGARRPLGARWALPPCRAALSNPWLWPAPMGAPKAGTGSRPWPPHDVGQSI